ncbi:hypothetical protein OROHE_024481 [Orobanche hederae]
MGANSTLSTPPMGPPALQLIEEMTRNAGAVQQSVLAQILAENAQTEYLKRFSIDGAIDQGMFKSNVPMITYPDIRPLIRKMADGDRSPILCAQPISIFLMSSGTSGEPKFIPSTKDVLDRTLLLCSLIQPIMNLHVKELDKGKGLNFMFMRSDTETQGGITARTALTDLYKSDKFKNRPKDIYTTPNEALYCTDTFQSMYTQMLCGLYEREQVNRIETTFGSGIVRVIRFLELNWKQLTHDIRTGSLYSKVTDMSIREYMTRFMQPNPELADYVGKECGKENWEGIITRIWPNTKYLGAIVTGTMAQYIPILDHYSKGLPIVSGIYVSSESYLGINLNPMCKQSEVSYTFMPFLAYFEFLPYEPNSPELAHSELVDLVDVKMGNEYEVVITTIAGLYRYRLGDIVRVVGYYNSAPQFRFVMRKNVLLSIDGEKTTEIELQAAGEMASELLRQFDTSVVDYTSFVDTTSVPYHYVIYWELLQANNSAKSRPSAEVLDQCCLIMEESLNLLYRMFRVVDKTIGPLEIRIVEYGTFEELMNNAISRGVSISQYKVPRCANSNSMVDLLDSRIVSKHVSPSLPHWSTKHSV